MEAAIATVLEKPISDLKAAYLSSFDVIKIPVAIRASANSIQCWPDEKPNTLAFVTSQSTIDIPSKREGTIGSLRTPYLGTVQSGHCPRKQARYRVDKATERTQAAVDLFQSATNNRVAGI